MPLIPPHALVRKRRLSSPIEQRWSSEVRLITITPSGTPDHFSAEVAGETVVTSTSRLAATACELEPGGGAMRMTSAALAIPVPDRAMNLIRFPLRRSAAVWVLREEPAWLVLAGEHGWLVGSRDEAIAEARWLGKNLTLPIREILS